MAFRPLTTALRHAMAGIVTIMACLLLWTIVYLVLLAWALLSDSGLGGPLAYPAGLLAVFLFVTAASILVFFPATLLSESICRRRALPQILAGIPLTCLFAAVSVSLLVSIAAAISHPPDGMTVLAAITAGTTSILIPLGIYWWTSQFPTFITRLYHKIRRKPPAAGDGSANRSSLLEP